MQNKELHTDEKDTMVGNVKDIREYHPTPDECYPLSESLGQLKHQGIIEGVTDENGDPIEQVKDTMIDQQPDTDIGRYKQLVSDFYNLVEQTGSHRAARRKMSRKTGIPVEDIKSIIR